LALPLIRSLSVVVDRDYRPRLAIAFILAAGLHIIAFWFFPAQQRAAPEEAAVSERVSISKRKPTPKPVPYAKPQSRRTLAPRVALYHPAPKAVAPIRKKHGGKASPHKRLAQLAPRAKPRPVSFAKNRGLGIAGLGIGGTSGLGVGSGGEGGIGSGVGGSGRGNAGDASAAPCGFVEFKPLRQESKGGKLYIWVQILVHLRNGETAVDDLHWPFVYAGDADNPWSKQNIRNPDFQTVMRLPPPDFNLEAEQEPATVLAVRQTGPDGFTSLEPCPEQRSQ
jgi:hypothetical protein